MPNLYETLLIVTPEADDEGVSAVIGDLRATIESDGGTVLQAGVWGRRKLAYMVKGKTEGIYVLIYADGERTLPAALKDRMKLDESVIRSMVVRLQNLQETEVRQQIAEGDHAEDAAEIEAQRVAAERRHEADAVAATMSLDEIVAAEAAEVEGAEVADSDEGEPADEAEAAGGDDDAPAEDAAPVEDDDDTPVEDAAPVEDADDAPAEDAAPVEDADDAPAEDAAPVEDADDAPAEDAAPVEDADDAPAEDAAPVEDDDDAPAEDAAPVEDADDAPAEDAAPVEDADDAPAEDAAPAEESHDEAPAVDSEAGAGDADDSDDEEKES